MPDIYNPRPVPPMKGPGELVAWVAQEFRLVAEAIRAVAGERARARRVTADTKVEHQDGIIGADATGGAITVTLYDPAQFPGRKVTVKRLNAGANAVTIAAPGAATIDGAASVNLTVQYQSYSLWSWKDGADSGWWIE